MAQTGLGVLAVPVERAVPVVTRPLRYYFSNSRFLLSQQPVAAATAAMAAQEAQAPAAMAVQAA